MKDVVIVGAGPAGLTAALYTARRSMDVLVISKDVGGQAATTSVIENYPGTGPIDGFELMQKFRDQAQQYGASFEAGEVHGIEKQGDGFVVKYNETQVETRTVILAFGLTPRGLGVDGEKEYTGKGVSYSTAIELDHVKGGKAVVVGGGNSAIESVNLLSEIADQVYLVHRRDRFRAEEVLLKAIEEKENVTKVLNSAVVGITGNGEKVTEVTVESRKDKEQQTLEADAVFLNIGFMTQTGFLDGVVDLNDKKEIIIDASCNTSTPGIFAAGDITTASFKQVVVSAGEGCKAALTCHIYVAEQKGETVDVDQDWDVSSGDHFIRT